MQYLLVLPSFIIIFLFLIFILCPKFCKNFIKSKISGSIAQFNKVVWPFALQAAKIAFSVAPTEI